MINKRKVLAEENIVIELKTVTRILKDVLHEVSSIHKEREISEDILSSMQGLKELIIHQRVHHDNVAKNLRADIKESSIAVEDKVDEALKAPPVKKKGFFKLFGKEKK